MKEDKEPVHFVTEMHRSIDGKTYKGLGQSRPHNVEVPSCRITIEGLNLLEVPSGPITIKGLSLPESLLESVSQTIGEFRSRLLDSIRIDLRPSSDDGLTTGAGNHVAVFSLAPFVFRFKSAAAFPAGEFRIDITHGATPVVDKHHPADSHSERCSNSVTKSNNETAAPASHSGPVAPVDQPVVNLLKTLPIDELHSLQKRIVPEALISDLCGHASDELRRRRQQ